MKIPRVLTIAGSDSGGGAGVQADIKAIMAMGGYAMTVITAVTAQNTLGILGIHPIPAEFVELQLTAILDDLGVDAIKTGMLPDAEMIEAVAAGVRRHRIPLLVIDPVSAASTGSRLAGENAEDALKRHLFPLATIVTPNIPEAQRLSGMSITTLQGMYPAAREIKKMGPEYVLIKGGHLRGDAVDLLYDGDRFFTFHSARIPGIDPHGTGCTYASAIATGLAAGLNPIEAVSRAKVYLTSAIHQALPLGGGRGPLDHRAGVASVSLRYRAMSDSRDSIQIVPAQPLDHDLGRST